jgi:hypothetical protein
LPDVVPEPIMFGWTGPSLASLFSQLLDAVLDLYHSLMVSSTPITQPTLAEIGKVMLRTEAWRRAWAAGSVEASLVGGHVELRNRTRARLEVPLTGAADGEDCGGLRSGWVGLEPGESRLVRLTSVSSRGVASTDPAVG